MEQPGAILEHEIEAQWAVIGGNIFLCCAVFTIGLESKKRQPFPVPSTCSSSLPSGGPRPCPMLLATPPKRRLTSPPTLACSPTAKCPPRPPDRPWAMLYLLWRLWLSSHSEVHEWQVFLFPACAVKTLLINTIEHLPLLTFAEQDKWAGSVSGT
eukprot:g6806.t1